MKSVKSLQAELSLVHNIRKLNEDLKRSFDFQFVSTLLLRAYMDWTAHMKISKMTCWKNVLVSYHNLFFWFN